MASSLFDPKKRVVSPTQQGSNDVGRLQSKEGPAIVVSIETAPGIFLHAAECVEKNQECRLPRVPKEWKANPPRIYVVPLTQEHKIVQNGGKQVTIARLKETNEAVRSAFLAIGCEVLEGYPTRFDRKDVI